MAVYFEELEYLGAIILNNGTIIDQQKMWKPGSDEYKYQRIRNKNLRKGTKKIQLLVKWTALLTDTFLVTITRDRERKC